MGKNVPDRWLNYKCHGKVIKGTKILAFKVPLKYETCRSLLPTHQFTPEMLMQSFPNLKYIIDLTATTRYYRRTDFTSSGVAHVKVEVPGQRVPKRSHSLKFFDAMDTFMQAAKADELIGVHCTHGLNRTGFMVCQYLIRQLGWDVSDAIKEFEEARGHTIEREPYLRELKSIRKGDKLITRIHKNLTDCKYDGRKDEKSTESTESSSHPRARKEPTNWGDHPPPLPISPPSSFNCYSEHSRFRGCSTIRRTLPYDRTKNVNNWRDSMKPSLSTGETQQNTYKHSQTQEYSRRVDKCRTIITPDQVATNIAERFRKLENTFPIIHKKKSRRANDFTADSYVSNSNTAHTVPISKTSKRKHRSRFD